jgi:hypothetical protein
MRKGTCQKQAGNEEKNLPSHQIISSSIYAFLQEFKGFVEYTLMKEEPMPLFKTIIFIKFSFIPFKEG